MATSNLFAGTVTCTTLSATTALVAPALSPLAVTSGVGTALVLSAASGVNGVAGTNGGPGTLLGGDGGTGSAGAGGDGGTANLLGGAVGVGTVLTASGGNANIAGALGAAAGLHGETRIQGGSSFVPVTGVWAAGSLDMPFFVATRPYRVKAIRARVEVASAGITASILKAASGVQISAGVLLGAAANSILLDGAAFTNQAIALSATAAALEIAAGDAIGLDFSGAVGVGAVGSVTVSLTPAT